MPLTNILPREGCAEFAEMLYHRFGINSAVYDSAGTIISGKPNWSNPLCPKIKGNADSLAAICAPSNQNFMAQAEKTGKAVIGECDAGFKKVAVPIIVDGQFLGIAGGCGLLPDNGELETFIIEKTLNLKEAEILALVRDTAIMTETEANRMAEFIQQRLADVIRTQMWPVSETLL